MTYIGKELNEEWQVEIIEWPTLPETQPISVPESLPIQEPVEVQHE